MLLIPELQREPHGAERDHGAGREAEADRLDQELHVIAPVDTTKGSRLTLDDSGSWPLYPSNCRTSGPGIVPTWVALPSALNLLAENWPPELCDASKMG